MKQPNTQSDIKERVHQHDWSVISQEKAISDYIKPGIFTNGIVTYRIIYVQQCRKCGLISKTV